jgi:nucleoside-diphosphate-sugar epimerase
MVIGNGLVAKRFESYIRNNDFLVFASGVSNSKTKNPEAYRREMKLLEESVRKFKTTSLVYFSTCSIYDLQEKESDYVKHKLQIEEYIQTHAKQYQIFRISNLAGTSSNPNTVLNFFFNHVKNGVNFDLWANACRNIIDIDDAYTIIDHILKNKLFPNHVINIANPENHPVKMIITAIETFLKIKSNYIEIEKGTCFEIDTSSIQPIIQELGIRFDPEYLSNLLNQYYSIAG